MDRMKTAESLPALEFHPVTPERWDDLEKLFGPHGASSGCWCMWWRLPRAQYRVQYPRGGQKNKEGLKAIVDSGPPPGLLAYVGGEAVAWCSVAPREQFGALERSRKLKRVDDAPVWSVVCFYVASPYRDRGLMVPLLTAAVEYARARGAKIVEGYPVDPTERLTGDRGYTGVLSAFRKAGFVEVARRGARPIMRRSLE
jgi:GNAT superfamily N-acetyltransferase